MARSENVEGDDFNRHLFSGDTRPDVSQVLNIRRNGRAQPFVARYILHNKTATIPIAPVVSCFVPIIEMSDRVPYDAVVDGKAIRRGSTRTGSFTIRDRRIPSYNDSRSINNVSFYLPMSDVNHLAHQLGCPRVEALPTLLDREHHDPVMFQFATMMDSLLARPSETSALFLDHIFQAVCVHVGISYGGWRNRRPLLIGGLPPRQVARVKDLLLANLHGDVSLECLAESCGLSVRHFARAFKQSTGFPPHRWLLIQRVERAQALLQKTFIPVCEIALMCGFADQSHLTRVFSKVVGVSPGMWRRERRF